MSADAVVGTVVTAGSAGSPPVGSQLSELAELPVIPLIADDLEYSPDTESIIADLCSWEISGAKPASCVCGVSHPAEGMSNPAAGAANKPRKAHIQRRAPVLLVNNPDFISKIPVFSHT
jgi:hypothetical protein